MATLSFCAIAAGQVRTESSQQPDRVEASEQWKSHDRTAQAALKQASECMAKALKSADRECSTSAFLKKAGEEYIQMELLLAGRNGHVGEATVVANGLLRSGLPIRAIEFLLSRSETKKHSVLSHLLADALFAIGDYQSAAVAYRAWISTGCHGYLYSMQDSDYWLMPVKGDRCASLPVVMRSRLEMLQDATHGQPDNLPEHNSPAGKMAVH
jgi:hypothetical protein